MFGGAVANTVDALLPNNIARTETFGNGANGAPSAGRLALVSFLTVLFFFVVILFVGKWLWNVALVPLVPALKPAKSVWQILGLSILIGLLHPGCSCTMY